MIYQKCIFHHILPHRNRIGLIALCIVLFQPDALQAQEVGDHQYTSEAIERGSRIYSRECALCHGPQGDIVDGVNLRAGIFKNVQSDDDLRRVVTGGAGQGQMPAFGLDHPREMQAHLSFRKGGSIGQHID